MHSHVQTVNCECELWYLLQGACFIQDTSRQWSGKVEIWKKFPIQKPRWEKLNWQLGTYDEKTYRKPSEQLFPNRRSLSYPKYENVHKAQTAQKFDSKT